MRIIIKVRKESTHLCHFFEFFQRFAEASEVKDLFSVIQKDAEIGL
jgi:hypothetical protein